MFGILGAVFLGIIGLFLWDAAEYPDRLRDVRLYVGVGFFGLLVWCCWFFVGGHINKVKFPEGSGAESPRTRMAWDAFSIALLGLIGCALWNQFYEATSVMDWVWFGLTICFGAYVITDRIRVRRVAHR
jgi:hypothetical protein